MPLSPTAQDKTGVLVANYDGTLDTNYPTGNKLTTQITYVAASGLADGNSLTLSTSELNFGATGPHLEYFNAFQGGVGGNAVSTTTPLGTATTTTANNLIVDDAKMPFGKGMAVGNDNVWTAPGDKLGSSTGSLLKLKAASGHNSFYIHIREYWPPENKQKLIDDGIVALAPLNYQCKTWWFFGIGDGHTDVTIDQVTYTYPDGEEGWNSAHNDFSATILSGPSGASYDTWTGPGFFGGNDSDINISGNADYTNPNRDYPVIIQCHYDSGNVPRTNVGTIAYAKFIDSHRGTYYNITQLDEMYSSQLDFRPYPLTIIDSDDPLPTTGLREAIIKRATDNSLYFRVFDTVNNSYTDYDELSTGWDAGTTTRANDHIDGTSGLTDVKFIWDTSADLGHDLPFKPGPNPPFWRGLNLPGYPRGWSVPEGHNLVYGEIYWTTGDGCWARVELADAPLPVDTKNVSPQLITSWSSTSITLTINAGWAWNESLSGKYLHVYDENNNFIGATQL